MAQEKTPGVYIRELPAFPTSVVEVATGVPAFLGYTEVAKDGLRDITGMPKRLSAMSDYQTFFGQPPKRVFKREKQPDGSMLVHPAAQDFYLYNALRLYFNNGGGPCWVVSVGSFAADNHTAADFTDAVWEALAKEQEPSIYVIPDAVALSKPDYKNVSERALVECQTLGSRVVILDVFDGASARIDDVISGPDGFRTYLSFGDKPSYGMAYYPWLNTTITEAAEATFASLDADSRSALADEITEKDGGAVADYPAKIKDEPKGDASDTRTHNTLRAVSQTYRDAMDGLLTAMNVLPPSAAMAGVFARTDNTFGVFRAPANTGVVSVLSPTVTISNAQQDDLNVPLDGHAVNAIRTFMGRGVLVWGARTLDGNSQDYRYINVRRTLIMLEQSIFYAAQAYVFQANVASTWKTVQATIENFLNNQWKAGALAGATLADAYDVSVGLGSTMTGNDILDGYMRVTVRVAISRPAEFIVITFTQKMQAS